MIRYARWKIEAIGAVWSGDYMLAVSPISFLFPPSPPFPSQQTELTFFFVFFAGNPLASATQIRDNSLLQKKVRSRMMGEKIFIARTRSTPP